MSELDPFANEAAWNVIVLAGVESPGIVELTGHKRVTGWDVAEASGQDGASTTRKGDPPGQFDAEFTLSNDPTQPDGNDFDKWPAFQALIESSTSDPKNPIALDIYHPDLARNHYTSVVKGEIGEMARGEKGTRKIKVHFLEYWPKKAKSASGPNGSKSSSSKTAGDTAIEDATNTLNSYLTEGDAL